MIKKFNHPLTKLKFLGLIIIFTSWLVIIYSSCRQKNNYIISGEKPTKSKPNSNISKKNKPDTILNTVTENVGGHRFVINCMSGYNTFMLNDKGDTIYQDSVYSSQIKFSDFNNDGYKDIIIDYLTNVPGIKDLLLFNKKENTFKKVINFQDFPAAERIPNSNYYYSYHRSGCADMNWDSDLFYIKDYKAIKLGNINGNQCENRDIKDGIYIHKISNGKEIEIQRLPIGLIEKFKNYKWGFIAEYWSKNYRKFL